jgi:phosphatidylserine decarboxylase
MKMPLGIFLLIVSFAISIFLLTFVNNIMGIRYIGSAFGNHIIISDVGYFTAWLIALALFGAGSWNIIDDIKRKNEAVNKYDQKKCPQCAETIKYEARVCKHCGYEYNEQEIERELDDRRKYLHQLQQDGSSVQIDDYKLLQIAYDYQYNQHDFKKARYYLEIIRKKFPQSDYLPYVEQRLAEMDHKEGNEEPSLGRNIAMRVPMVQRKNGQGWQPPIINLAPPVYRLLIGCGILVLVGFLFNWWLIVILGLGTGAFIGYCFRDPERPIPADPEVVVSPSDGKVLFVDTVWEDRFLKASSRRVAILLGLLDVHVNRAPVASKVVKTEHQPGQFASPVRREADKTNEQHIWMLMDENDRRLLVVQMAGQLTRRIVPFAQKGQRLDRGERLGMICFGSRVDLFLPLDAQVTVAPGDQVLAGAHIVAKLR